MAEHKVFCVKLKKELPGLDEPPFDTELGQKVYDNVSLEAWKGWTEFCKMLLNEYRLNPARREDQAAIVKQMEQYFFGEGAAPPKEYVHPPEIIRININTSASRTARACRSSARRSEAPLFAPARACRARSTGQMRHCPY